MDKFHVAPLVTADATGDILPAVPFLFVGGTISYSEQFLSRLSIHGNNRIRLVDGPFFCTPKPMASNPFPCSHHITDFDLAG
ncbi:MAG: hypothetical protein K2Q13_05155 [Nitrosomonas sp.]|uniref:hypothetical protein n=1 Tax=Nitrosomonas sp. TaxID=42353 RepID=UPI0025FA0018|nr:hypothetical protein [Nitrosomonas sp.]MBY0474440.1 hypothetical protein [Nitrosomonas sp.]